MIRRLAAKCKVVEVFKCVAKKTPVMVGSAEGGPLLPVITEKVSPDSINLSIFPLVIPVNAYVKVVVVVPP